MKYTRLLSCLGISILSLSFSASAISQVDAYPIYHSAGQQGDLTPMTKFTFEAQQRDLFTTADLNNDSQVTFEETQDMLIKQQLKVMKKQFDMFDKDYSGYLNESEMGLMRPSINTQIASSVDYEKQVQGALDQFDTNKDGSVSKDEMLKGIRDEAEKHISKSQNASRLNGPNPYFTKQDTDKSGGISFEEYSGHLKSLMRRGVFQPVFMRDKNGDGSISYSENEAFITDIFVALDQDNDGELSPKEQMNSAMHSIKNIQVGAQGLVIIYAYGATHIEEVLVPAIHP